MAMIDVEDETVIVVAPEVLARALAARWASWWPGLRVTLLADRGVEGMDWAVSGPVVGTSQVRLVPVTGGVMVRYRLAVDPATPGSAALGRTLPDSPHGRRQAQDLQRRYVVAWKRTVWSLKDDLEA